VPVWAAAVNKSKKHMKKKEVPVLAIGAAFCFTIMMFNIPIPGGSSAHAVGAVLLAILLGPWEACIGVSVALVIQALMFGDGGILAVGANCFNMAFIMPMVGYGSYHLLKGKASPISTRGIVAAALAAYIGINITAILAGVEFGSQYYLFRGADGTPLYFMYPLKVAVLAMMAGHLTFAGAAEALVTALGVWFVGKNYPSLLERPAKSARMNLLEGAQMHD
jgi:cobalt/nickel transport system permease protein